MSVKRKIVYANILGRTMKNRAAQSLARLARGVTKRYSAAELTLRSERLALARLKRWPLKRKP